VSAGCLHRFSRDGLLLQRIALPVPSPTMPCFAGDALFVTSLTHAAQRHVFPSMGGLFRLPATVAGCPVDLFDDTRPK
jgi:sugar lactone lactonase YvrE